MTNATTFIIFSKRSDATRVCRRLDGYGIPVGVRGSRGNWEVFGFLPDRMTSASVRDLALKLQAERRA